MAGTMPGYLHDYPGRNSRPSSPARQPLTVDIWLDSLGLLEYLTLFAQYRYVQDLLSLTESDLRDRCGIKNGAHRARLVSSLVMIRETMQRQRTKARTPNHFDTISSSLPSLHGGFSSPGGSPHSGGSECNIPRTSVYQPSPASMSYSPAMNYYASPKSLPAEDIASNVWYHGAISRVTAEDLVRNNGDFLVRDSSTQHGDYVLTVRWNSLPLHFVVNRRQAQGCGVGNLRSVYHFEENAFDTVTDLIQFYVRHRKSVTEASGAIISVGVPSPRAIQEAQRTTPMTLAKYGSQPLLNSAFDSSIDDSPQTMERRLSVPSITKMSAVDISIDDRQQSECSNGGDEVQVSPVSAVSSSLAGFMKVNSDTARTGSDSDLSRPPPPKPSRLPTIKIRKSQADKRPVVAIRNHALYDDDGKDYSDYDQVKSWPEKAESKISEDVNAEIPQSPSSNNICLMSRYDCDEVINHESQFLTPDNRPLESSAVTLMKTMVFDTPPAVIARHITIIDLELLQVAVSTDLGYGVSSGLELITLPQGRHLRQDVIERFHCLRLFVSVLVLKCSSAVERGRMINLWIQTAMQLQSVAFGNLYAFSAIMHALLSAPISRLTSLWLLLRQQYGASSVAFENRLCSLQRALDSASVTAPVQRPTVPYVLPLAELLEGTVLGGPLAQWSDIDTVLSHLNMARIITAECKVYRSNAAAILSIAAGDGIDSALIDMLGTPTHMRLLWGTRGIGVDRAERLAKFELVITALSDKIEPRESSL